MLKTLDSFLKRVFDLLFSIIGLIVTSPIFFVLSIWTKLDSEGPIFYRSTRVGQWKNPIMVFKFRTMVVDADKIGGPSTANNDRRITNVGRKIRRYKLDELPQLLNVLKGDMSFVGPRPEVEHYVNMFSKEEEAILCVRPGITDWATLWNSDEGAVLAGSADPEKAYMEKIRPEKLRLQLEYVRNRTLWIDVTIIIKTLVGIISRSEPEAVITTKDSGAGLDRENRD